MRLMLGFAVAMLAAACATDDIQGGPRPPQGPGPAGTEFGFWDRDAEGAVDADFRTFIMRTYNIGEEVRARTVLEKDGFNCRDANRPDGRPVPSLECERVYSHDQDVHAWVVEFWAKDREPRAHYMRTHIRDTTKNYKEKRG